jgi:hypothetical protein
MPVSKLGWSLKDAFSRAKAAPFDRTRKRRSGKAKEGVETSGQRNHQGKGNKLLSRRPAVAPRSVVTPFTAASGSEAYSSSMGGPHEYFDHTGSAPGIRSKDWD